MNDGWGQRHFSGLSASFAIKPGQITQVNVGCSVINAGFSVIFDESFRAQFTSYSVTITEGNRILVFDETNGGTSNGEESVEGQIAYFNIEGDENRTITYTIDAVGERTIHQTGTKTLSRTTISRIRLKTAGEDTNGSLGLTITIDDTFEPMTENLEVE